MHGDFFEVWFEKHLRPELFKDDVIILDNASFHRKKKLFELAKKYNLKIIFLPHYSPELNPIEHFWNWPKKKIVDLIPYFQKFDDVIYSIFQVL